MIKPYSIIAVTVFFAAAMITACSTPQKRAAVSEDINPFYPQSPRSDEQLELHGTLVAAPYQWLEQLDSAATLGWITQQNHFTKKQLDALAANRFVKERLTELFNVVQVSAPVEHRGAIFYLRNDGLQSQPNLYMQRSISSAPLKIVDASQLSDDGSVAITQFSVSPDANYVAYAVSNVGQDWSSWYIKDLSTGRQLDEVIEGTKFSNVSWYPDGQGFYYSRYPKGERGFNDQQPVAVFYHQLNTSPKRDIRLTTPSYQPGVNPYPHVTSDGKYLLLRVQTGPNYNEFLARPLRQTGAEFKKLHINNGEHRYLGSSHGDLYFYSRPLRGKGQVVRVTAEQWQQPEIVIEEQKLPLVDAALVGKQLITHYLDDAQSRVMTFDLTGKQLRELALPGFGTVSGFAGGANASQTFFKFSSYTRPGNIYRYQPDSQRTTLWFQSELPVDEARYQTQQIFVTADDGTQIPVFLVQPRAPTNSASPPVLLHGYGGFGKSLTPSYRADFMAWLELGGVLAIANVRGGGEYGSAWHHAAIKQQKPRAISDFVNVAQWLTDNGVTQPSKLVAHGSGHGGLLVTAAMLKRPDLFAVILAEAGVYDLLRYQTANANALAWQSEFGISSRQDDFATLLSYSPLHNVADSRCYPSTLITTGARDQRVAPWHSFKFTAALQHAQACDHPILLDIGDDAGHGDKTPLWLQIERTHRQWTFALNQLQVDWLKNSDAP